jgi:hypothetical protein
VHLHENYATLAYIDRVLAMAGTEFRLLGKALALGRFTAPELARAASAKPNSVASWLRRNPGYVEQDGTVSASGGRGRPQTIYRIKEEALSNIRARLDQLFPQAAELAGRDLRASGYLYNVDRAHEYVEAWRKACQHGSDAQAKEAEVAARSWIRIAWEDFADLHAGGLMAPFEHLASLAELEREVGAGDVPTSGPLAPLAKWLVKRLDEMSQRGVKEEFAASTLRARALARSRKKAAALTAAALAAEVWWDEGLSDDAALDARAVDRCASVANLLPADKIPQELTIVLDRQGPYQHPEQSQAIVLGIAKRSTAGNASVHHWLSFLLTSSDWQNELAPAVLYGLGRAGHVNIRSVLNRLHDSIRDTLNPRWTDVPWAPAWHPGRVRTEALRYCRTVLDNYDTADQAAQKLETQFAGAQSLDSSTVAALLGGHG